MTDKIVVTTRVNAKLIAKLPYVSIGVEIIKASDIVEPKYLNKSKLIGETAPINAELIGFKMQINVKAKTATADIIEILLFLNNVEIITAKIENKTILRHKNTTNNRI